ncbi:MAG: cytochrome c [Betaproteobacteria bacterium]|nr:cytochrome c [Betaproteobacteria bacterium]
MSGAVIMKKEIAKKEIAMRFINLLAPMTLAAGLITGQSAAFAASPEKGKVAYIQHGCWGCHGTVGQGALTGPKLAPEVKPLAFYSVFVRNTKGAMPPYQKAMLSDADLEDIHAYIQTIQKSPDYKSIPLLNQ